MMVIYMFFFYLFTFPILLYAGKAHKKYSREETYLFDLTLLSKERDFTIHKYYTHTYIFYRKST